MEKKSKLAGKIAAVVVAIIFIGSMFAIFSGEEEENQNALEVNGYKFYESNGGYSTKIQTDNGEQAISFSSNPEDLGNISVDEATISALSGDKKVYITFNPNQLSLSEASLAYYDLGGILGYAKGSVIIAFTEDSNPVDPNVPLRTCADSDKYNIIELSLGDVNKVVNDAGCVKIIGKDTEGLQKASSKLAMWLVGVKI